MKIAIMHEMLVKLGGAEKVVENWMLLFPEAPVFTLIYDENKMQKVFPKEKISPQVFSLKTQKVYNITGKQRISFPYMAQSVEQLDFSEYDVVLCSSSGFAHGIITKPDTKTIVYCHSPARYMWDWTNEYKRDIGLYAGWKKYLLRPFIEKQFLKLRQWDFIASNRSDVYLANSQNTKNRINKYYKKEVEVVYPPVETQRFAKQLSSHISTPFSSYYIIISALTEFKKIEVAIKGFNELSDVNLVVIGDGDYKKVLEGQVVGNNIIFTGPQYGDDLVSLVQQSNGLVFPGEEDFGIVPIEVMAAGKPVFAYHGGGLLETVKSGVTGDFFSDKNGQDFVPCFELFHKNNLQNKYGVSSCQKQAEQFSKKQFEQKITSLIHGK